MIPESESNSILTQSENQDQGVSPLKFQFTGKWNGKKPSKNDARHTISDWKSNHGLKNLIQCRNHKQATRLCVKDKNLSASANCIQDISSTSGFYIDSDTGLTLGEFKKSEIWQYVCFIQPSYSFDRKISGLEDPEFDSCDRWHATIIFDQECINTENHKAVAAYVMGLLGRKVDASVKDPGRIEFPSGHLVIPVNLEARLNLKEWVEKSEKEKLEQEIKKISWKTKKQSQKNVFPQIDLGQKKAKAKKTESFNSYEESKVELDDEGVAKDNDNFNELLHQWFWNQIIIEKCDGDIRNFFSFYYPHFNFRDRTPDKEKGEKAIIKYDGFNPFSDNSISEQSGSSFVCAVLENQRINWSSRNHNQKSEIYDELQGKNKYGGSVFDFVYLIKKNEKGMYLNGSVRDNLIAIVFEIAKDFKLDQEEIFNFNIGFPWLYKQLCRDFKGKLYAAGWYAKKREVIFWSFDKKFHVWKELILCKFLHTRLIPYIQEFYPYVEKLIVSKMDEKEQKKYKGLFPILQNYFQTYGGNEETELKEYPLENYDYLVFRNGVWNHKTQKLEPNNGQALNTKYLPFDYQPIQDNHATILAYKQFIQSIFDMDLDRQMAESWHIMCVTNKAGKSSHILGIGGVTRSFKTTYVSMINNMLPGLSKEFQGEDIFNRNNNHATAALEGLRAFSIQELHHSSSSDLNRLLNLFGNESSQTLSVNPKNCSIREVNKNFAFTFDFEGDTMELPVGKTGYFRRIVTVKTRQLEDSDRNQIIEMLKTDLSPENMKYLLFWMINQDREKAFQTFKHNSVQEPVIERQRESLAESDTIYAFIRECIEIVEDVNFETDFSEIYLHYLAWCLANQFAHPVMKRKFSKPFRNNLTNPILGINWKENKKESNGKTIYRGLRIKSDLKEMLTPYYNKILFEDVGQNPSSKVSGF